MQLVFTIGLVALFLWAVANIALWFAFRKRKSPEHRYYRRQMDALWNTVNLVIAGNGLVGLIGVSLSAAELERTHQIVAINVFVNFIYIAAGLFMLMKFRKSNVRISSYGQSIIIQGIFLFVLDSTMTAGALLAR